MDKATEIPMDNCGLKINVGRDGCWLHFSSEAGVSASFNVNNMAECRDGIIGRGLREWCSDRVKQANQLDKDNSQFGVGA